LQTIESSSKTNEAALEAKIQELNKKEGEIIDMKVKIEKLERDMRNKAEELNGLLEAEKINSEKLKKDKEFVVEEKNKIIQNLENKYDELNRELKSYYNTKNNNDEFTQIKNENLELKVNLGKKEKQLNSLKEELKEYNEKKSKEENNKEINLNSLKNSDIPKLKEIYKAINKTILEYSDKINKLEQNKEQVFHDKFIEFSKLTIKKICKNWNEELSQFKEDHFKTMIDNYRKEVSDLKKDNTKLMNELELRYIEINEKNIEILKLKETIKSDKELSEIKDNIVKSTQNKYETVQKEMEIYKVRLDDKESMINDIQIELGKAKSEKNILEDEVDNMIELISSINRRDKKSYGLTINKMPNEIKIMLDVLIKNYNVFKNEK
jgi:DNA repair exonuclease SbcCD ATPase subunit